MNEQPVEYVEVREVKQNKNDAGVKALILVLNGIVIIAMAAYILVNENARGPDRQTYMMLLTDHMEAKRRIQYLEHFSQLKQEQYGFEIDKINKCFRKTPESEKVCADLDYKIKRYSREINKVNRLYREGKWVKDKEPVPDYITVIYPFEG